MCCAIAKARIYWEQRVDKDKLFPCSKHKFRFCTEYQNVGCMLVVGARYPFYGIHLRKYLRVPHIYLL